MYMMKLSGKREAAAASEEVSVCQICEGFAGELPSKYGRGMPVMSSMLATPRTTQKRKSCCYMCFKVALGQLTVQY